MHIVHGRTGRFLSVSETNRRDRFRGRTVLETAQHAPRTFMRFARTIITVQFYRIAVVGSGRGITVSRAPRVVQIVRKTFEKVGGRRGAPVVDRFDRQKKTFFAATKLREIFMLLRGNKGRHRTHTHTVCMAEIAKFLWRFFSVLEKSHKICGPVVGCRPFPGSNRKTIKTLFGRSPG